MSALLDYEAWIRFATFATVLAAVGIAEAAFPRRARGLPRSIRWPHNLALVALNGVVLRLVIPGGVIGVAVAGEINDWGLLNSFARPDWIAIIAAIVLLDLSIYLQHVMFHAVPTLWRLHRVHHADLDFDVTTGLRFHPIEILLSAAVRMAVVAAIGAPAIAVLLFEAMLNALAMFNHANLRLSLGFDRVLRWFVVTPDMHRVHHSVVYNESASNFGFNLPWWDRLLGTYRAQPSAGHDQIIIGVDAFRSLDEARLDRLLTQPFRDTAGGYSINRRPEVTDDSHQAG